MRLLFRCTYRGKQRGFEDTLLTKYEPIRQEMLSGDIHRLMLKKIGPEQSCMLYMDRAGRLSALISGIGRRIYGREQSPWSDGGDAKIMNVILSAEDDGDNPWVLRAFGAFVASYEELGDRLLSCMQMAVGETPEYLLDYKEVTETVEEYSPSLSLDGVAARTNTILAYYTPYETLTGGERSNIRRALSSQGVEVYRRAFITGVDGIRALRPGIFYRLGRMLGR